jgi:hypothetical protein
MGFLSGLLDVYRLRSRPDDPHVWHKWSVMFPVRLIDGSWLPLEHGQLWRRWNGQRWEYKADRETPEDYERTVW